MRLGSTQAIVEMAASGPCPRLLPRGPGSVLIAGGSFMGRPSAEIYDPTSGTSSVLPAALFGDDPAGLPGDLTAAPAVGHPLRHSLTAPAPGIGTAYRHGERHDASRDRPAVA